MTNDFLPPHVNVEALMELYCDEIKLAIHDFKRGPGVAAKRQRRYATAVQFLERLGVLNRVAEVHGIDIHTPRQQTLLDV